MKSKLFTAAAPIAQLTTVELDDQGRITVIDSSLLDILTILTPA